MGHGLKHAGENVVAGFAAGLTGIFKEPAKGARTEGIGGFFKVSLFRIAACFLPPLFRRPKEMPWLICRCCICSDRLHGVVFCCCYCPLPR